MTSYLLTYIHAVIHTYRQYKTTYRYDQGHRVLCFGRGESVYPNACRPTVVFDDGDDDASGWQCHLPSIPLI
jgi:hypothetical protein